MYQLLFVDDEPLIREGVSQNVPWLQLGYELAGTCENGKEAREFLCTHPVDVVVTDICMPFVDGMELSAFIQKEFPGIKVLILSGYDDFDYAKSAIKYGVEEYLLKPITSLELSEVLTSLKEKLDREREEDRRREEIYTVYRKGHMLLCSDALLHTITGSKTEEECRRDLQEVGINLDKPCYLVGVAGLSIYIGDYELNEKRKKESALMAFIVYNLSQEIMKDSQGGEVCQGRDNRVFLLFQSDRPEEDGEKVTGICGEIIRRVNETMSLNLNIGLGTWQRGLKNIYRSYEQAENALLQQYNTGDNRIINAADYIGGADYFPQIERIMDNCVRHIRENDAGKLEDDCEEMARVLEKCGRTRRETVDILLKTAHRADQLLLTLGVRNWRGMGEVEETIRKAPLMRAAVESLLAYMSLAAECLDRETGSGSRSCAYQAMEFMEANYGDSGLSLQGVCSHLGVSTSRFSSIFKETFGSTFLDVLIGIRMKKAKELLEMTELKTYEIAERVGFGDPHYFSIAFKKVTGKTPKEYARERKG